MSRSGVRIGLTAGLAALCAIAATGAAAQDPGRPPPADTVAESPTGIRQMNPDTPGQAAAAGAAQVSGRSDSPLAPGPAPLLDRAVEGSAPPSDGPVPYAQLTTTDATADPGAQVTSEPASAGPAPSAAVLALGRVTDVATPDGPDRCDPQGPRSGSVDCDRVIEARAGEFSAPDHQPLSAEQRLLATQRPLRPPTTELGTAMRRLSNGELDESDSALAIASIALQQTGRPAREEQEEPADLSTALDAIVSGITSLVGGTPPTP